MESFLIANKQQSPVHYTISINKYLLVGNERIRFVYEIQVQGFKKAEHCFVAHTTIPYSKTYFAQNLHLVNRKFILWTNNSICHIPVF